MFRLGGRDGSTELMVLIMAMAFIAASYISAIDNNTRNDKIRELPKVETVSEFLPKIRPNNRCARHGVEHIAYGRSGICGLHLPRLGR
jgi:hypothetical protein